MEQDIQQRCRCYMKDCGCSSEQTEEYLKLAADGCTQAQICFLKRHRNQVMDQLHAITRQIDCIDFIIHELEQEGNLK